MPDEVRYPELTLEVPLPKRESIQRLLSDYFSFSGFTRKNARTFRIIAFIFVAMAFVSKALYGFPLFVALLVGGVFLLFVSFFQQVSRKWAKQYTMSCIHRHKKVFHFGQDALTISILDLIEERIPYSYLSGYIDLKNGLIIKYGKIQLIGIFPWEILTEETRQQLIALLKAHSIPREESQS